MKTFALIRFVDVSTATVINLAEAESPLAFKGTADGAIDVTDRAPRPAAHDTYRFADKTFTSAPVYPVPVGPAKSAAHERVNAECGAYRRNFITDITAQETTYSAKYAEVKTWNADVLEGATPAAQPTRYPYLNAEAVATGKSITEVKMAVEYLGGIWYELGARIEGKRLGMHAAIDACATVAEVAALFPIQWPTP